MKEPIDGQGHVPPAEGVDDGQGALKGVDVCPKNQASSLDLPGVHVLQVLNKAKAPCQ